MGSRELDCSEPCLYNIGNALWADTDWLLLAPISPHPFITLTGRYDNPPTGPRNTALKRHSRDLSAALARPTANPYRPKISTNAHTPQFGPRLAAPF